ncbi:MAG: hypothetical protein GY749_12180 [Desulfobacteraceae bacterium]|nr:hypothetical protein [Desulfobacteraceae bacterium]
MTLNFRECTLRVLEKHFGLKEVMETPLLNDWLNSEVEVSDFERRNLQHLRKKLKKNVHDWNETELACYFIGPVLSLVDYTTDWFNLFAERQFSGVVDGIEMRGKPDGLIASGLREPETPFFCFQEYKKEQDPEGDPAGQVLGAMLVAQELNEHICPVYGCYVRGRDWFFMVLQGREYCVSEGHQATRDDIFDIFRILKGLKQILLEIVGEPSGNK